MHTAVYALLYLNVPFLCGKGRQTLSWDGERIGERESQSYKEAKFLVKAMSEKGGHLYEKKYIKCTMYISHIHHCSQIIFLVLNPIALMES